jgi:hypothetical protein
MRRTLRKRSALYLSLLSLIVIIGLSVYFRLQKVEQTLETISTQPLTPSTPQTARSSPSLLDEIDPANPFSDLVMQVAGKSGHHTPGGTLDRAIADYVKLERNKAFYLALDQDGRYAFGMSSRAQSIAQAEKHAKKICEQNRRKYGIGSSCIPYALNDAVSRWIVDRQ